MNLHELAPVKGSVKPAYRKGRGPGSGNGKTAGKGHKGQNARSGGGVRIGFEGGQMPLQRRLPKRGFNNIFAKTYVGVNVSRLDIFDSGAVIDVNALIESGIVKNPRDGIKILGDGEITKNFTVKAAKFTKTAQAKIEAAGGKTEVI